MSDLNGDLGVAVRVDTLAMPWVASPSRTVQRKRVHLVGAPESGQVTSVVRYEPGATFPAHDHPEGEEIFVLDGVFSDEHGDWPAGTYLLNPEGFRHAPRSEAGCTLFVKLRQYPGLERQQLALDTLSAAWEPEGAPGCSLMRLYSQPGFSDHTRLERWAAGASCGHREYAAGVEIFVLAGSFRDEHGEHGPGTWLRLPPGAVHRAAAGASEACTVYIKEGGFAYLRNSPSDEGG